MTDQERIKNLENRVRAIEEYLLSKDKDLILGGGLVIDLNGKHVAATFQEDGIMENPKA